MHFTGVPAYKPFSLLSGLFTNEFAPIMQLLGIIAPFKIKLRNMVANKDGFGQIEYFSGFIQYWMRVCVHDQDVPRQQAVLGKLNTGICNDR